MKKNIAISRLLRSQDKINPKKISKFFKTKLGEYAEHDKFLGITVPIIRKVANQFHDISFQDLKELIASEYNEERLLALMILVHKYNNFHDEVYRFYLSNIKQVNNWNLVDSSAHLILGAYLFDKERSLLVGFACSDNLWLRRISIIATWYFIKKGDLTTTFEIAKFLINDRHDLIHKAGGWMLREAGKVDKSELIKFLDYNHNKMPRTMLRYAIEKFSVEERKQYLRSK
jgi:3-methyladenine DNA glycosylase AlkD